MIKYTLTWLGPLSPELFEQYGSNWDKYNINILGAESSIDPYPLGPVNLTDANRFDIWLKTLYSETVLSYEQLIAEYELSNPAFETGPKYSYSTIWMGPVNPDWAEITGGEWAAGRIEFYGKTGNQVGETFPPLMNKEDWDQFSDWLKTFVSSEILTLEQLVAEYEKFNPSIRWWEE